MSYETVQNSTRSDGWIKKSTFVPYTVRVLISIAIKRVFKCFDPLIYFPIMLYLFFTLFIFRTCNFAPFFFFFLAFILTRELRPGNIQYWHHHRPWYGQLKRTLRSPLMIGATANMQKHNWYTNGQNIIKVYNALAFITNGSKIINISNYSQTEGQRPIKRNKES